MQIPPATQNIKVPDLASEQQWFLWIFQVTAVTGNQLTKSPPPGATVLSGNNYSWSGRAVHHKNLPSVFLQRMKCRLTLLTCSSTIPLRCLTNSSDFQSKVCFISVCRTAQMLLPWNTKSSLLASNPKSKNWGPFAVQKITLSC